MFEGKRCAFCKGRAGGSSSDLGTLLGPVASDSSREDDVFVHRLCALWSPEVYQTDHGTLRCVWAAVKRSRGIRCFKCGKGGASTGCRVDKCQQSFHLACAKEAGCAFYPAAYMLACPAHMHLFSREARLPAAEGVQEGPTPGGVHAIHNALPTPLRTPDQPKSSGPAATLAGKKSAFGSPQILGQKRRADPDRHVAVARSALKRLRAELRAAADHSSDDETHFARKEARRLLRARGRLAPVVLGGRTAQGAPQVSGPQPERKGATPGLAKSGGVQPVANALDWGGFEKVGGLREVVRQLREMVLLPLQYPQLFQDLGVTPPRGILLHGEPGTGKTLVARALAGACAAHSPVPVTFFARKAADCLGKFSGEAERTLRLLFHEAQQRAPSIIFMDELDGLVPARSGRSGGGDQIYASVVSTLLALMDGVTDRGAVVVLAATNRPDAIDPALRRPGRFDRDVYFGLPSAIDRADILRVHTAKWPHPPSEQSLQMLAQATEGYAGADLRALCGGAVSAAVRRCAPSLFENLDESALPHYPLQTSQTALPTNGHPQAGQLESHVSLPQLIPLAESCQGSGTAPSASQGGCPSLADAAPQKRPSAAGGAIGPGESSEPASQGIPTGGQGNLHDALGRARGGTVASTPLFGPGVGVPAVGEVECDNKQSDGHAGTAEMADMEVDRPSNVHAGAPPENFQPPDVEREVEKASAAAAMETLPLELDRCVGTHMAVGLDEVNDRTPGVANMAGRGAPEPLNVLSRVKVLHCDWRCALAAAPAPCAQRQGLAMAAGAMQRPMPWHLAPVLLPSLADALLRLGTGSLPLPHTAEACIAKARVASDMDASWMDLENVLQGLGVVAAQTWPESVQRAPGPRGDSAAAQSQGSHPDTSTSPTPALGLHHGEGRQTWPLCRLLVTGEGDAGQSLVSGALLRALVGVPLHCLSLAALVVAGEGDPVQGCIHIVQEALQKASPNQTVVFFMPSVEAWALVHARISQQDLPGAQAEGEPPLGQSGMAQACVTPAKADGSSPSPFRGLVSLEQRGQANPTIGWAQQGALQRSPGSLPQNLRSLRRASDLVDGPLVPTGPGKDHTPSGSSLGFAGRATPGRLPRVPEEDSGEDEEMGVVEMVAVSRTWQAFEQVVRQVPATQPLLILATSQHASGDLPEPLMDFFGNSSKGPTSRIIQLDPTTLPTSAWTEAVLRCVAAAAQALATEGAAEILRYCKACLQGSAAAKENVSPGHGPMTAATEGKEAGTQAKPIRAMTLNIAEREQGLKLLEEVRAAVRVFCTALYRDRRAHAAYAVMTAPGLINPQSGPGDPIRLPLAAVAKRGSRGNFGDPAEFMDEMRRSLAASLRPLAGDRQPAHNIRTAATAALLDEIDTWRYALETRLSLNDPALRLLYDAAVQEAAAAVSAGAAAAPNNAEAQLAPLSTPAGLPANGMVVSTGFPGTSAMHTGLPGVPVQNLTKQDAFQTPAHCSGRGVSDADACHTSDRAGQEGPSKDQGDDAEEHGLKAMAMEDPRGLESAQLGFPNSVDISQEPMEVVAVHVGTASADDGPEQAADDQRRLCGVDSACAEWTVPRGGHAVEPGDVGGARVGLRTGTGPVTPLQKTGEDTARTEGTEMRTGTDIAGSVDGNVSGRAACSGLDAAADGGKQKITGEQQGPGAGGGTNGLGNGCVSESRNCPQSRDIERALYARLKVALVPAMSEGWQREPSCHSLPGLDQLLGLACGRAATWAREAVAHIAGPPAAKVSSQWPDTGLVDALADALGAHVCQALRSWQPRRP